MKKKTLTKKEVLRLFQLRMNKVLAKMSTWESRGDYCVGYHYALQYASELVQRMDAAKVVRLSGIGWQR
jgi:hypothetical protein